MTSRDATAQDVATLVDMGERFAADRYAGRVSINREMLASTLAGMIDQPNTLLRVLEDDTDNGIHGAIGVIVFCHPFSGELVASETFWWVDPRHRGCGIRLMREAEKWATARGAAKMQMGEPAAGPAMANFYERCGYEPVESTYQRSL